MSFRFLFSFFVFVVASCLAAPLPKGAPLSSREWEQCERFIQKKAKDYFSDHVFSIAANDELPCPIQKDPKTGALFIHLKGRKGAFIGQGANKVVTKSILYGKKPRIVARCESSQDGKLESSVLERMHDLRGVVQSIAYIPLSDRSSEIFLEYYPCGSLDRVAQGSIQIRDADVFSIMKDLIIGLKGMHDRGYIHRDIKRANIYLYREKGKLHGILGDLGLCLNITLFPDKRIAVPNPNCSPEVLLKKNSEIDRRKAETYSLGTIFYLIIFQKSCRWCSIPQGDLPQETAEKKRARYQRIERAYQKEAQKIHRMPNGVRKRAALLMLKMMAPDPAQRISLDAALRELP